MALFTQPCFSFLPIPCRFYLGNRNKYFYHSIEDYILFQVDLKKLSSLKSLRLPKVLILLLAAPILSPARRIYFIILLCKCYKLIRYLIDNCGIILLFYNNMRKNIVYQYVIIIYFFWGNITNQVTLIFQSKTPVIIFSLGAPPQHIFFFVVIKIFFKIANALKSLNTIFDSQRYLQKAPIKIKIKLF